MTDRRATQLLRTAFEVATAPLPDAWHARLQLRAKLGYWPRLERPRTFSERLQAKKVFDRDPRIPATADKYLMRAYVQEVVGAEYLPELYEVVERAQDVDVASLPRRYAMKATHGSGWNRIVHAGDLDTPEAQALAARWLRASYYRKRREWAYRPLTPRVIFEENLASNGVPPDDYKIFSFSGRPHLVQVDRDRFGRHARSFFGVDWTRLDVTCDYPPIATVVPVPERLDEMLHVAARLGSPFGFARIDLYALPSRLLVGEITHYPDGGVVRFTPAEYDRVLGEVWGEAIEASATRRAR